MKKVQLALVSMIVYTAPIYTADDTKENVFIMRDGSTETIHSLSYDNVQRRAVGIAYHNKHEANSFKVWDANTGKEIFAQKCAHPKRITALYFNPDGNISSHDEQGTHKIWDQHTGTLLRTLHKQATPILPLQNTQFVLTSPDTQLIDELLCAIPYDLYLLVDSYLSSRPILSTSKKIRKQYIPTKPKTFRVPLPKGIVYQLYGGENGFEASSNGKTIMLTHEGKKLTLKPKLKHHITKAIPSDDFTSLGVYTENKGQQILAVVYQLPQKNLLKKYAERFRSQIIPQK